ncbi:MAG TPA: hypothetical protein VFC78_18310 [Tepidisphaeraceae bacterium]|nr:hypothetical protein [Tepidisphaeraceae bacterium]
MSNLLLDGMPLSHRNLSGYELLSLGVRQSQPYRPGPEDEMHREKKSREALAGKAIPPPDLPTLTRVY